MNLSFRHLLTFVEVMRSSSSTEAARTLGRTQPAISAMIAGLEEEIGFPLFDRVRKRLVPKPEAYYFLEEAEVILDRLSQSARTLQEIGNLEKGKLKIACNPAGSNFFMPSVVGTFLEGKPDVEVSLMMRSSPIVRDWIASQQYDVGFAETSEPRRTILSETFALPCLCAMPKNDPLASRDVITPSDLDSRSLAMLFEEHSISQQVHEAFRSEGAKLQQRFEVQTCLPAVQLVSQGLCYTITECLTAISHRRHFGEQSNVVFKPFRPDILLDMSLLTPANRPLSLVVEAFVSVLRSEINRLINEANSIGAIGQKKE